ncbi:MAG: NAD(P)/FAD-dependent oxidoreductase [Candidatus Riflebacteria bacterium]|nr:NAD(P)/FAD-dependent oxidoreductase [Candidatus Riflebacteria bacterium]
MDVQDWDYVIVGSGLAGVSAIEGIRESDKEHSILMIGADPNLPYDRPPLSKKLWLGKKKVEDIFLHGQDFYDQNRVTLHLGNRIEHIDPVTKIIRDNRNRTFHYGKLLLATGGIPQVFHLPGGNLEEIFYFRTLDDYKWLRERAAPGKEVVVVGGGFIGSEMAAALCANNLKVTMMYGSPYICSRVFPESLGKGMENIYREKGIRILKGVKPTSFERQGTRIVIQTNQDQIKTDLVVAGIGIKPNVGLAEIAGLKTNDGILVNSFLQTSHPDIYAAGDNTRFHCPGLGREIRLEHWDNALKQGKLAGKNMAGASEPYTQLPFFFSDLFEFGYEAVGEIDPHLEIFADWQKENDTGVIYYLRSGKLRGALMCNVWDKVEKAKELIIQEAGPADSLRGAIQ